ncbi:uncharacterized protein FFB20_12279 [Fusarium fujikuroi]|nr:uncharacterized protein Y057_10422 [Fusarium fujikuroi]SCO05172.1 uncharacterized protein FFB20_12279 [Fusarium fujikuroi]SCO12026.1 uncharacterized protein FFC1_11657 [Fusarium fujikuroi]SCO14450.1 uncharacterized protein FFE2_13164 [Fusarium fujikuroi]SCO40320.1 uncharacterized protein FFNC_07422 [Fusarium fujikuroi]
MPSLEGIEVAIVTQPELAKLPEFPLSDFSSRSVLPPADQLSCLSLAASSRLGSLPCQLRKTSPRISVYVPSDPGSRFGFHYAFNETSQLPRYLYFKIFMNGRNITNCGVRVLNGASGSITRSLCEPSERWKYKEDGVLRIRDGIEARCFSFLPHAHQSVAEDGGLIEVQVFRAKGRIRRLPILEGHRGQESYGIGSPSGGLLDSPDEACFYDWILIDSKESPFVSFRFLYRSLLNLRQLSLAPHPELEESSVDMEEDMAEHASEGVCSIKPLSTGNICTESPRSSVLDDVLSAQGEDRSSTRPRRLTEAAPMIASQKALARPLPEVPIKKPVDHRDIEKQVEAHEYTSLSDIQEEIENTDTSIASTTSFLGISDSPRSVKARVLELNDCGIIPLQSALKRDTSSTILESLVNYSEQPAPGQARALSTSTSTGKMGYLETGEPEQTSEMKSIVAETEHSFRTGWRLSESEWIKGEV